MTELHNQSESNELFRWIVCFLEFDIQSRMAERNLSRKRIEQHFTVRIYLAHMPGRSKELKKPVTKKKSPTEQQNSERCVLTRDTKTDSLSVFTLGEIKCTKDLAELVVGDVITHGSRGNKTTATIVSFGECFSVKKAS